MRPQTDRLLQKKHRMQIALTLILALLAVAAVATAMRAIVIARAAAWMDMVAIGATDSCESAGYVGCSVVCTGVENMQQIESLLDVEYDRYETIVVLDARAAGITFRAIVARYDLIRVDADPSDEFPSARIRSLFRSRTRSMRRLTLVDRAAASPYDDLDAGASVASYDYILPVGRDTYLMPNAIEKAVIAIASTPDTPIAALHSVSDDQCYVFNRETLIAQGGFSPHLLNSIRSGEVRRTFVPLIYRTSNTRRIKIVTRLTILILMATLLTIETVTLGTRLATASAAAVAMALANAAYARTALGRYNCFEKSILCYIDRMFSILGKRKFTIS